MEYRKASDLYELLPTVYRLRDAQQGYPLRALLSIISQQVEVVQDDIDRLWDNLFVETCDPWVIPYIGDLVGNTPLYEVTRGRRADVGKTIYYRRRKGTLPMLEELSRDVTGWGAHVVDFFELMGWTQNLNHLRLADGHRTADLRQMDALNRLNGPFDQIAHTAEVRTPYQGQGAHRAPHGRYNIPNVGIFLWRLSAYPLYKVDPREAGSPRQFLFNPQGGSSPLFHNPLAESEETALAKEMHVPGPIRSLAFQNDLETYYGYGKSLVIYKNGALISPNRIMCKNLANWASPPANMVAVDVTRGRMRFSDADPPPTNVRVSYCCGFSADMGGGTYRRAETLAEGYAQVLQVKKGATLSTVAAALAKWVTDGRQDCIIEIGDSRTYAEALAIEPGDGRLVIQAADGQRPTIVPTAGGIRVTGNHPDATLTLNGLVVEGGLQLEGDLGGLNLLHCTLVPGRFLDAKGDPGDPTFPSLVAVASNVSLTVTVASSICGPLRLPAEALALNVTDSILDGLGGVALTATTAPSAGPPTSLERVTVLGQVYVKEFGEVSEAILTDVTQAERVQSGCIRFSFVLPNMQTPRQYECQPMQGSNHLRPVFTSTRYGNPAYAQLSLHCPLEIRTGAHDGSEMGAFASLQQPQRLANLRIRLEEYLPFGRDPALIFVT